MKNFKKIFLPLIKSRKPMKQGALAATQSKIYKDLLHREAIVGGQVFGAIPADHRREFFCLDERTWIWHEEWIDASNKRQRRTTRYDIRPNGILKVQNGSQYQQVIGREADNLLAAATLYWQRVESDVYARA